MALDIQDLSIGEVCRSPHFSFASIYAMIILPFWPMMMLVFNNYKIVTAQLAAQFQLLTIVLQSICIAALFLDSAILAAIAYCTSDAVDLVLLNRPNPWARGQPVLRYFGPIVAHHLCVFLYFLLIDLRVRDVCDLTFVIATFQSARILFRTVLIYLYYRNKRWDLAWLSLACLFLSILGEVAGTAVFLFVLGPFALVQVVFIVFDADFSIALHRQYSGIKVRAKEDKSDGDESWTGDSEGDDDGDAPASLLNWITRNETMRPWEAYREPEPSRRALRRASTDMIVSSSTKSLSSHTLRRLASDPQSSALSWTRLGSFLSRGQGSTASRSGEILPMHRASEPSSSVGEATEGDRPLRRASEEPASGGEA